MEQTFTIDDYVRYIYNETDLPDTVLIQRSIDNDEEVEEDFQQLVKTVHLLDKILQEPRQTTVNKILEFSRNLSKVTA
jgi:hypothetical protein